MRDDRLYLLHIVECIQRIEDYTRDGMEAFLADPRTQDAVIRNLEIMGEAAKRVSQPTRDRAPEVPWRRLGGLRDVLIHQYQGVDLNEVWRIAADRLGGIKQALTLLVETADQG